MADTLTDDVFFLTEKDKEFLIELWKLPFLEGCKRIGIKGEEIKTLYGTVVTIKR